MRIYEIYNWFNWFKSSKLENRLPGHWPRSAPRSFVPRVPLLARWRRRAMGSWPPGGGCLVRWSLGFWSRPVDRTRPEEGTTARKIWKDIVMFETYWNHQCAGYESWSTSHWKEWPSNFIQFEGPSWPRLLEAAELNMWSCRQNCLFHSQHIHSCGFYPTSYRWSSCRHIRSNVY